MKQFFILLLSISMSGLFAQSLTLLDPLNNPLSSSDTLVVSGSPSDFEIIGAVRVANLTGSDMGVKVKKYEHELYAGSTNVFCWYQCYLPSTYAPDDTVLIVAHDTVDRFTGHLMPGGISGTILMKYTWYNENDANDSVSTYIRFIASGVGINESPNAAISRAYPNPASDQVTFSYSVPTNQESFIVIQDLIGSVKMQIPLDANQNEVMVDLRSFSSGIYIYSLLVEGRTITTRKLNIL